MTDLVGQGLALSDMPLTNYEDSTVLPPHRTTSFIQLT